MLLLLILLLLLLLLLFCFCLLVLLLLLFLFLFCLLLLLLFWGGCSNTVAILWRIIKTVIILDCDVYRVTLSGIFRYFTG